jgi:hypothetical protein
MTMHVGYVQRGAPGVWVAGSAFIVPAATITLGLTWAYVAFRDLSAVDAAFYGIQPVVLAIIAVALVRLAPRAADDLRTRLVFVAALALGLLGVDELLVLALGANIDHGLDTGFKKRLVIARVVRRATQPKVRRDFIKPTVALYTLVNKANEGEKFVEDVVEEIHESRIARSGVTGK